MFVFILQNSRLHIEISKLPLAFLSAQQCFGPCGIGQDLIQNKSITPFYYSPLLDFDIPSLVFQIDDMDIVTSYRC